MDVLIEVRKVVLASPFFDLMRLSIGSFVGVLSLSIALVEPALILPLELVVKDDAIEPRSVLDEAFGFTKIGPVDLSVMFHFARLLEACVELLLAPTCVFLAMAERLAAAGRFEHVSTLFRQDDGSVSVTVYAYGVDKALLAQMAEIARARIGGLAVVIAQIAR
jgi:hypothetical protein